MEIAAVITGRKKEEGSRGQQEGRKENDKPYSNVNGEIAAFMTAGKV